MVVFIFYFFCFVLFLILGEEQGCLTLYIFRLSSGLSSICGGRVKLVIAYQSGFLSVVSLFAAALGSSACSSL